MDRTKIFGFALVLSIFCAGHALAWRSSLYPENWAPQDSSSFSSNKLIQDFSYAGYQRGEVSVPTNPPGLTYNVTNAPYNADNTGSADTTAAIQQAIDDAGAAGGGIVYLPAGTYDVQPGANSYCLSIASSNVVIRGAGAGQTFLLNTSYDMRSKAVIKVSPSLSYGSLVTTTADLDSPTRRLPVTDASGFSIGDKVQIQWEFTQEWIDEHNQGTYWSGASGPSNAKYFREVTAVNVSSNWIEVDVPTRYTMKTRDNTRVQTLGGLLSGIGIEDLSIGNVQNPNTGFGESDYSSTNQAAYNCHASWLISLRNTFDCWVSDVASFQPAGNSTTCHMLSNGIGLSGCFRVTIQNCSMQRSQYGGGGGNGYMYRMTSSNDNLIKNCLAHFSRHGFVISHAGTSGNVFLGCTDSETKRSTGNTGSYTTSGSGSDHHMHFSHSNLYDDCLASNSFWTAHHRGTSGTVPHGLSSAHSTYWNTRGEGSRYSTIVTSEQGRYGYIIGTSGSQTGASNPTGGNTAPADHLEGIGSGATLQPQSLHADQLAKRMAGVLANAGADQTLFIPDAAVPLSGTDYSYSGGATSSAWSRVSGPTAAFADTNALTTTVACTNVGIYTLRLTVWDASNTNQDDVVIEVLDSDVATLVSKDYIIGESDGPVLDYYPDGSANVVGVDGGTGSKRDRNIVFGYSLPTLASGSTVTGATFNFEITGARDTAGTDPSLHLYLLNTADPDSSGTNFFYQGVSNSTPSAKYVGETYLAVGSTEETYLDDEHDIQFTVKGDALALLQSYYGGDNIPDQSEIFFRFNLDVDPTVTPSTHYNRYRIDLADDESILEVLGTDPPPPGSIIWSGPSTLGVSSNSADASVDVNTNLTKAVLVWDTSDNGTGSTNAWPVGNRLDLGSPSAGSITGQLSSLLDDTEYTWRYYGETASTSGWSSAAVFTTALTYDQKPVFTSAVAVSSTSIDLGWQDNAQHETSYVLQRSTNGASGYAQIAVLASNTVVYTDTGLSDGTTYYYRLAATNSSNSSVTSYSLCQTNATTKAVVIGSLISRDSIVGRRQAFAPAFGYYVDSASGQAGVSGSNATTSRVDRLPVFGFSLPVLPAGTTVSNATLNFEITGARDDTGRDPSITVYLLSTSDPDSSGTNLFYHGPSNTTSEAKFVGSTFIDVIDGISTNFADDEHDQSYVISGEPLQLLKVFYGGDNIPEQSEVFFRFSLDVAPVPIGGSSAYDRYFIDAALDEASLAIEAAPPEDSDSDGLADVWETIHFGGLTNTAGGADDMDGDGFVDLHEYLAGTEPTNASSLLAITEVKSPSGPDLVCKWYSEPGKFYAIERTEDIGGGWSNILGNISANSPINVHTTAVPSVTGGVFYRVVLDQ